MKNRKDWPVRVLPKVELPPQSDAEFLEPAERLGMMWQLALDAWAFKERDDGTQSTFQRHVVRVHRRRQEDKKPRK